MNGFSKRGFGPAGTVLALGLLAGCQTTKLSQVTQDPSYDPSGVRRVFVIVLVKTDRAQKMLEDEFVRQLQAQGRQALASYTVVPHDQELDRDAWKRLIAEQGYDTVIVSRLVDMKVVEKDIRAKSIPVGNAGSGYGYYGTAYASVYQPDTYIRDETASIETRVVDVAGDRVVWSVHSKTKILQGGDPEVQIRGFVKLLMREAKR